MSTDIAERQDMTDAGMYRKKPVTIEAFQWTGPDCPLPKWAEGKMELHSTEKIHNSEYLLIPTLEGKMQANRGDWIIKGVKGELYPCKPDIFEATYTPANEPDPAISAAEERGRREMKEAVYRICANVGEGTDIEDGEMVAMRISGLTAALPEKGLIL
jgi:hypothetical protein